MCCAFITKKNLNVMVGQQNETLSGALYKTLQYNTVVQYSTVQYSTVQYSTVQYSTVQYCTVQYSW